MKKLMKLALGAAMLGGLAVTAAAPAEAGVSVGIGIGAPGYAHPHARWCYRHPHRCGYRNGGYYATGYSGAPTIGVYYGSRGWWDGHRYWGHRYRWHGGWRYR